jgi:hypothetical protein
MMSAGSGWLGPLEPANDDEQATVEQTMISLDAFLVFLEAAALPILYILVLSRWLEPEFRRVGPDKEVPDKEVLEAQRTGRRELISQPI